MSVVKANKFIRSAKERGWDTKYQILSSDDAHIEVTATRGPEKVVISWVRNQLNGPPIYTLHDMTLKLHSAKVAHATVLAPKPDLSTQGVETVRSGGNVSGNAPAADHRLILAQSGADQQPVSLRFGGGRVG
jgi:hypothetical protein